jgi:hypothetical protein
MDAGTANGYHPRLCVRSSMDRVLPSEGRGCWFDPSRARHKINSLDCDVNCRTETVRKNGRDVLWLWPIQNA